MKIDLITVPYHSGRKSVRSGRGPNRYIEASIFNALAKQGKEVTNAVRRFGRSSSC